MSSSSTDTVANTVKPCKSNQTLPFHKLFSFADTTDLLLMVAGTIGAVANGAAQPLMTILFGNMIDSFGGSGDVHDVVHKVSKVALDFVFLAVGSGIASFLQVSCWMATGERQASRIRNLYLKSMLQQEIAFFDKDANTEEVVGRMSGDAILIQDAMGDKVGKFIHLISTFFAGFTVAFVRGWILTLIMLSVIPLLVAGGAAMSTVVSRMASQGQQAYTEASTVRQSHAFFKRSATRRCSTRSSSSLRN